VKATFIAQGWFGGGGGGGGWGGGGGGVGGVWVVQPKTKRDGGGGDRTLRGGNLMTPHLNPKTTHHSSWDPGVLGVGMAYNIVSTQSLAGQRQPGKSCFCPQGN